MSGSYTISSSGTYVDSDFSSTKADGSIDIILSGSISVTFTSVVKVIRFLVDGSSQPIITGSTFIRQVNCATLGTSGAKIFFTSNSFSPNGEDDDVCLALRSTSTRNASGEYRLTGTNTFKLPSGLNVIDLNGLSVLTVDVPQVIEVMGGQYPLGNETSKLVNSVVTMMESGAVYDFSSAEISHSFTYKLGSGVASAYIEGFVTESGAPTFDLSVSGTIYLNGAIIKQGATESYAICSTGTVGSIAFTGGATQIYAVANKPIWCKDGTGTIIGNNLVDIYLVEGTYTAFIDEPDAVHSARLHLITPSGVYVLNSISRGTPSIIAEETCLLTVSTSRQIELLIASGKVLTVMGASSLIGNSQDTYVLKTGGLGSLVLPEGLILTAANGKNLWSNTLPNERISITGSYAFKLVAGLTPTDMSRESDIIYSNGVILSTNGGIHLLSNIDRYLPIYTLDTHSVTLSCTATASVNVSPNAGQTIIVDGSSFKGGEYALVTSGEGTVVFSGVASTVTASGGKFYANNHTGTRTITTPFTYQLDGLSGYSASGDHTDVAARGIHLVGSGKSYYIENLNFLVTLYAEDPSGALQVKATRMPTVNIQSPATLSIYSSTLWTMVDGPDDPFALTLTGNGAVNIIGNEFIPASGRNWISVGGVSVTYGTQPTYYIHNGPNTVDSSIDNISVLTPYVSADTWVVDGHADYSIVNAQVPLTILSSRHPDTRLTVTSSRKVTIDNTQALGFTFRLSNCDITAGEADDCALETVGLPDSDIDSPSFESLSGNILRSVYSGTKLWSHTVGYIKWTANPQFIISTGVDAEASSVNHDFSGEISRIYVAGVDIDTRALGASITLKNISSTLQVRGSSETTMLYDGSAMTHPLSLVSSAGTWEVSLQDFLFGHSGTETHLLKLTNVAATLLGACLFTVTGSANLVQPIELATGGSIVSVATTVVFSYAAGTYNFGTGTQPGSYTLTSGSQPAVSMVNAGTYTFTSVLGPLTLKAMIDAGNQQLLSCDFHRQLSIVKPNVNSTIKINNCVFDGTYDTYAMSATGFGATGSVNFATNQSSFLIGDKLFNNPDSLIAFDEGMAPQIQYQPGGYDMSTADSFMYDSGIIINGDGAFTFTGVSQALNIHLKGGNVTVGGSFSVMPTLDIDSGVNASLVSADFVSGGADYALTANVAGSLDFSTGVTFTMSASGKKGYIHLLGAGVVTMTGTPTIPGGASYVLYGVHCELTGAGTLGTGTMVLTSALIMPVYWPSLYNTTSEVPYSSGNKYVAISWSSESGVTQKSDPTYYRFGGKIYADSTHEVIKANATGSPALDRLMIAFGYTSINSTVSAQLVAESNRVTLFADASLYNSRFTSAVGSLGYVSPTGNSLPFVASPTARKWEIDLGFLNVSTPYVGDMEAHLTYTADDLTTVWSVAPITYDYAIVEDQDMSVAVDATAVVDETIGSATSVAITLSNVLMFDAYIYPKKTDTISMGDVYRLNYSLDGNTYYTYNEIIANGTLGDLIITAGTLSSNYYIRSDIISVPTTTWTTAVIKFRVTLTSTGVETAPIMCSSNELTVTNTPVGYRMPLIGTSHTIYSTGTIGSYLQYSTGVVSQTGTAVTGAGFTSNMVGGVIVFADGADGAESGSPSVRIVAVTDATTLVVSPSQSVAECAYVMYYGGSTTIITGTAGQSATVVTGSGTSFDATMVGGMIQFGTSAVSVMVTITSVIDTTHLVVDVSQTVAPGSQYVIYLPSSTLVGSGTTFLNGMRGGSIRYDGGAIYRNSFVVAFTDAGHLVINSERVIPATTPYELHYGTFNTDMEAGSFDLINSGSATNMTFNFNTDLTVTTFTKEFDFYVKVMALDSSNARVISLTPSESSVLQYVFSGDHVTGNKITFGLADLYVPVLVHATATLNNVYSRNVYMGDLLNSAFVASSDYEVGGAGMLTNFRDDGSVVYDVTPLSTAPAVYYTIIPRIVLLGSGGIDSDLTSGYTAHNEVLVLSELSGKGIARQFKVATCAKVSPTLNTTVTIDVRAEGTNRGQTGASRTFESVVIPAGAYHPVARASFLLSADDRVWGDLSFRLVPTDIGTDLLDDATEATLAYVESEDRILHISRRGYTTTNDDVVDFVGTTSSASSAGAFVMADGATLDLSLPHNSYRRFYGVKLSSMPHSKTNVTSGFSDITATFTVLNAAREGVTHLVKFYTSAGGSETTFGALFISAENYSSDTYGAWLDFSGINSISANVIITFTGVDGTDYEFLGAPEVQDVNFPTAAVVSASRIDMGAWSWSVLPDGNLGAHATANTAVPLTPSNLAYIFLRSNAGTPVTVSAPL